MHRRRIAGFNRRLQLGQIPDEASQSRERVGQGGSMFVNELAGLGQAAAEFLFRLARGAVVDVPEGKPQRQRGHDRARQEDAVGEGGNDAHFRKALIILGLQGRGSTTQVL